MPISKEQIPLIKPGITIKITGGPSWNEDAKFMIGKVLPVRSFELDLADATKSHIKVIGDEDWGKYKNTYFNPNQVDIADLKISRNYLENERMSLEEKLSEINKKLEWLDLNKSDSCDEEELTVYQVLKKFEGCPGSQIEIAKELAKKVKCK